jgi:hypothetical protein
MVTWVSFRNISHYKSEALCGHNATQISRVLSLCL